MALDVRELRQEFPALDRMVGGNPITYLDSAATTLKPRAVIDAVVGYMSRYSGNIHRGKHLFSEEASEAFEGAREAVAQFVNARVEEVVFVHGTTEAINLVADGLCLARDENVVGSILEHHSNILPWRARCEYRAAPLTAAGIPDVAAAEALIDARTRALTVTLCSNVTGVVIPIDAWVALARRHDLPILVDAAQAAPHRRLDLRALDCDFLVFSGHKMLGPTGVGVLCGKKERLAALTPRNLGGGTVSLVRNDMSYELRELPWRLEPGTPDIAAVIGLKAAVRFLEDLGRDELEEHDATMAACLATHLGAVPDLAVYAPARELPRAGIASMWDASGTMAPDYLARVLSDTFGIMVRGGHHCAHPLHDLINPRGSVRASTYLYTTEEEVERLAGALRRVIGSRRT
ncbi:MAG: cysteine desulfurase [Deltaproteobacteria bacterium]|nr:cysteine desulfurase [Deltaproteobacteria bacterium]